MKVSRRRYDRLRRKKPARSPTGDGEGFVLESRLIFSDVDSDADTKKARSQDQKEAAIMSSAKLRSGIDLGRGPCKVAGIELVEPQSVRRDEEARSPEVTYNRHGVLIDAA
jgi:hypothetical protein